MSPNVSSRSANVISSSACETNGSFERVFENARVLEAQENLHAQDQDPALVESVLNLFFQVCWRRF